jgi:hypothetical protein
MAIRPSPLLSAGAVATIDRLLGRLRVDVCTVQRPATDRGPGGAPSTAFGTIGVAPCRVQQPAGGTEVTVGGRQTQLVDYVVRLSRAIDLASDDRIRVGDLTLQVVSTPALASSGMERVAYCVATG